MKVYFNGQHMVIYLNGKRLGVYVNIATPTEPVDPPTDITHILLTQDNKTFKTLDGKAFLVKEG